MAVIEIKKDPSARELRLFGLLLLLFCGVVAGLVYWHTANTTAPLYLLVTGAAVTLVYYAVPPLRRWIYLGWLYAAFPIGWCISMVLLAVTYYLVVTPIGLVMRLSRYDPMGRRPKTTTSYWVPRAAARPKRTYLRQF